MCDRVGVLYAGTARRGGRDRDGAARPAPSLHRRPAPLHPARRPAQGSRPARHDPRLPPEPRRAAAGLRVRDRVRARGGALPRSRSRRCTTSGGTHVEPLPLPRARADAAPRAGGATSRCRASTATWRRCSRSTDLGKVFKQQGHDVHALVGVSTADLAGRDARPRRRVGQRQDDARADAPRDPRADHGRGHARGQGALSPPSRGRSTEELRALQIVFQNPDSALNRRHQVRRILRRSLKKLAGLTGRRGRASGCSS